MIQKGEEYTRKVCHLAHNLVVKHDVFSSQKRTIILYILYTYKPKNGLRTYIGFESYVNGDAYRSLEVGYPQIQWCE